ncbi:beta-glucosidase-like glycosyl hydrolase/CubicO group peptidase (beta-lactamase class C family) [Mesonia hippocampi]|uniref:beta-N-acetylhexosaminidase n=1 Tax=Mesonia hippocampi TaxID=1628250 RepID=A0A840ERV4_9FLAO|nr:glycoside hydrolase family 3 N-terminal domain-containing protein [Mesonia hippocampi]MBB4119263.1 beta-glucosidase-like glycosyl hydrolase/CubicO group peptidase (beta-lactamase class C family) [Mesonia hippocampi]
MKKLFFCLFFLGINLVALAQSRVKSPLETKDYLTQKKWVDSTYNTLSLQEKIGQLFMVDIFSNKSKKETDYIKHLIQQYHIGGIIFSKGGPQQQAKLTNEYQQAAKVPLLIAMDAEWGLAMRLDSTYAFPWNMTLGAIEDDELVKKTGAAIARHCKRLGVHVNFGPVVDINNNPANPIIGNRSFGEDKYNVTQKAIAFMQGMHQEGVLSSAKHFPGHGDTDIDSHKALPRLDFSRTRLDSLELYPFREIIKEKVSSVMVGHLNVPALEGRANFPSSLSKKIISGLIREEYAYEGLIFTDALNMNGVADYAAPGEVDLEAFLAGNDILLISKNIPKASAKLYQAYQDSIVTEERLAYSVKKILMAKYQAGLNNLTPVDRAELVEDLNTEANDVLYEELLENAITLIKNDTGIIPVKDLAEEKIAYVHFGDDNGDAFFTQLNKYAKVDKLEKPHLNELITALSSYTKVIIGFHKSNQSPWKSYKFTNKELVWLHEIARVKPTILSVFTRPYALLDVKSTTNLKGIVIGYQNSEIAQNKMAELIFGAIGAKGKLPVSIGKEFPVGTQFKTKAIKRLSYSLPERVGIDPKMLYQIDAVANRAVNDSMTPGLQVLVARRGKVVYQKNFGYHTYQKKQKVKDEDLYDVASLTKILATLPLFMELYEKGEVNMQSTLKDILPELSTTNKADISLKRMLSHYARFKAWIPFYVSTLDSLTKEPSTDYFSHKKNAIFSVEVAPKMYMRKDYQDTMYHEIAASELREADEYKYSDLPYYLLKKYIETHYSQSLDKLVQQHLYKSLGASRTSYLPLQYYPKQNIIPTEDDTYWRMQTIQGTVHDQGAAMQGGIGGHAGLFSNANDVAKIMQMYLNKGYYGGKRYFKETTIAAFNTCYYCDEDVRRGVGFDKPQLGDVGPTCGCVSMTSFGHTGFTGTYAWADPEAELIYVFLSNRTYPDAGNRKLITENIRTDIQRIIYDAIID